MQNICIQMTRKAWMTLVVVLVCAFPALAQKITVTGTVYEPEGEPAIGASVAVQGHANMGVVTDYDGNYTIQVDPNATLVFSYIGCDSKTEPVNGRTKIDVHLSNNAVALQEVVAIGYGTVKKSDATGSVGVVKPNEIEAGLASSAQDLLVGASPGVVVTTNGGEPYGGAQIRIRGGASLSASNDPLIVIDGVPMSNMGVSGVSNPLSLVNPENIESMTILKDASATAIYGSRASNGVIIITTKSGKSGRPQVNFAANFFINTPRNYVDMMDGDTYSKFIKSYWGENSAQAACLGENNPYIGRLNTDWQKEILRTSFSQDYSLSVGGTAGFLPYRVAVGYTDNQGIVKKTGMKRLTGSINLTPKFFDDLLSVNANVKGSYIKNDFEEGGPLGAAVGFNPTLPVHMRNAFNNYTTFAKGSAAGIMAGNLAGPETPGSEIDNLQTFNPVAILNENSKKSTVYQSVGNLQFDLKMPFLRELSANLNLGYDYTHGQEKQLWAHGSPQAWNSGFSYNTVDFDPSVTENEIVNLKSGYTNRSNNVQKAYNLLLDLVLTYNKKFDAIKSELNVQGGYSWQKFKREGHGFSIVDPSIAMAANEDLHQYAYYQYSPTSYNSSPYQLVSFFGRLNYIFMDRYLLTATVRHDGTSRFGKDHRWGTFPAFALGWKLLEEPFMEGARSFMNELKIRAGYGVTGQQGLDNDFFPYLPKYYQNPTNLGGRYPIGDQLYFPLNPDKYNSELKWESTHTWNVGFDYAFLNNRINGSFEWYRRKTKDLLLNASYPAGSNNSNEGFINAGDLTNTGIEFNITARPVQTGDFTWTTSYNIGYNKNKINRLAEGYTGYDGEISNNVMSQRHEVGHPANSFYVYEQVYDEHGDPLEGVYVDQNGDGMITPDDRIYYHSINPDVVMTWSNTLNYKNWDFGIVLRGSFNNWVYNQTQMGNSFVSSTQSAPIYNLMDNTYLFKTNRSTELMLSNYWVQNASYVRCDNITLGYTWQNLFNANLRVRAFGAVQNPFVITKYKGLDPEVANGMDNSPYPRPITVSFGVVATF